MVTKQYQSAYNILMAVDGSEHANAAISLVADLPLNHHALAEGMITVLAVIIPRNASDYAAQTVLLEKTTQYLQEKGFHARSELLCGNPAEMLIQYADDHRPDLFVLGAKGLRSTLGILLGGVAQQIVEYAKWPVLVVRSPYRGTRHILLVTDGSRYSQRAVEYLSRFPLRPHTEVQVLHVLPPLLPPEMAIQHYPMGSEVFVPVRSPEFEDIRAKQAEEEEQTGRELLAKTIACLNSNGIEATSVLLRGDAASEIIEYVRNKPVELIIAGSRGLSQVKSWLMGSVSRKLVHYSDCNVLVVKGDGNG